MGGMDWNTVANIASPLLLAAIGLAIRDQARKAAKSAMDEFEPRFRLLLAEALAKQLKDINGTYVRTPTQEVTNTNFRERLNSHSERIRDLERSPQFRPIQGV